MGRSLSVRTTAISGNEVASGYLGATPFSLSVGLEGGFSSPQQDFHHVAFSGAAHGRDSFGQSELIANQAVHIDGILLEEFERRREAAAARADDADFVDDQRRRFYFRRPVKCRFQNEHATRMQEFNCKREAFGRSRCLDDDSELSFALLSFVDGICFNPTSPGNREFRSVLSD